MNTSMSDNNNDKVTDGTMVFRGNFVHSTRAEPLVMLRDAVIGVKETKIVFLYVDYKIDVIAEKHGFNPMDVRHLKDGEFLIPGFVDTHIHAPQYVISGTALDLPLLDWLQNYTFPAESKFSDIKFAERAYTKAVKRTTRLGTTTACYFASIHAGASLKLADVIDKVGQRAFVGKVNMDRNAPNYYIETTEKSLQDTEWFIEEMKNKQYKKVEAIITPRFVPSCTLELMNGLSKLAAKHDLPIQSHLSENKSECRWVEKLHPQCDHYTDVYYKTKLLTEKTVMAHCIYCGDNEIEQLKETKTGVSHCPNSNVSLKSGILDVRRLLNRGVKVGLGTDVSGGYHPSILDAIRYAVGVSKLLAVERESEKYSPISYQEAFRMATLGGSEVLGLEDKIGNFEVGKEFDALVIDTKCEDSPFDTFQDSYTDSIQDVFQKFIFLGDDRNIREVYVAGEQIHKRL